VDEPPQEIYHLNVQSEVSKAGIKWPGFVNLQPCEKKFNQTNCEMINNVAHMSMQRLEEELNEMEDSYGTAFTEGTSPEVLQSVWERIKELKKEIERRKRSN
jgi:hypothetical protein